MRQNIEDDFHDPKEAFICQDTLWLQERHGIAVYFDNFKTFVHQQLAPFRDGQWARMNTDIGAEVFVHALFYFFTDILWLKAQFMDTVVATGFQEARSFLYDRFFMFQ